MSVLLTLIRKELIQTLRDKRMRFIVFAAPVIQLVIFGYVATTDIKNISMVVYDLDQSSLSRELVDKFIATGFFKKVSTDNKTHTEPSELLKRGQAKVTIVIPPDFSRIINRKRPAEIQIQADGSDANAALITKSYVEEVVRDFALDLLNNQTSIANISVPIITPHINIFYNPELKSSHYMVPGIICLILLMITALLTALAITRERESGTLEQLLVSPLRRWEFIVGKTLPFVLIGFIDVVLILAVGKLLFQIPIQGSLILLFFTAFIFLFTTLGIGLFAASVSKTQAQAMFTIFPIMMPAFLLSGLFFPISSIPPLLRWVAYINPLTYYLIIVRGILLKGVGLFQIYPELIILAVFGLFFMTFSILRFQKRIG